jgi:dTDP-4-amino-4,6-dideoxygalactose transaminase
MIPVTKPFLPPLEEYKTQLKRAYDNQWLTNRGELVLELETKMQNYLGSYSKPLIMNNGTIPLQIALKLLGNGGEIITTPFSYVATTNAIIWEGCTPVFVDVNPLYWTIDETKIEAAITKRTTCILATHVFGNPCNVEVIEVIAKKYNLYVVYDAAHCFGVQYDGKSIFDWGDISTCSFHATKVFHTGEGGAAFINNQELFNKVYFSHNFGHNGPEAFHGVGINGKISELNAAMGLTILPYMDEIIERRLEICEIYKKNIFCSINQILNLRSQTKWNGSYFPFVLESEDDLLVVLNKLNQNEIFPRRYFFPSLNLLPYIEYAKMEQTESLSKRILSLPVYHNLSYNNL